ncbi:hypothetical protein Agub_g3230, partial [Astrephomene gubernaculifera]
MGASEWLRRAMPEAGIGLFPDIGASFFLRQLPGQLGRYMGLTGERLAGMEVKDAGFATHLIHSSRLPELESRLVALGAGAADLGAVNQLLCELEGPLQAAAGGGGG